MPSTYDQYLAYKTNVAKNVKAGVRFRRSANIHGPRHPAGCIYKAIFTTSTMFPSSTLTSRGGIQRSGIVHASAGYLPFGLVRLTLLDKGVTSCVYFNKQLTTRLFSRQPLRASYNNEVDVYKTLLNRQKVSQDLTATRNTTQNDVFGIVADDRSSLHAL